jgi:acetolactate synthase small subunit
MKRPYISRVENNGSNITLITIFDIEEKGLGVKMKISIYIELVQKIMDQSEKLGEIISINIYQSKLIGSATILLEIVADPINSRNRLTGINLDYHFVGHGKKVGKFPCS